MRRCLEILLVMCAAFSCAAAGESGGTSPGIVPDPRFWHPRNTGFVFTPQTAIILGSDSEPERFAARQVNDELAGWGTPPLAVRSSGGAGQSPAHFIFIGGPESRLGAKLLRDRNGVLRPEMAPEGYFLDADSDGIVIIGESDRGRFYGVMSLLQMMRRQRGRIVVEGGTILDFPDLRIRGITDDISRGQVSTVENFKKIIRFLARYKLNAYSPYMEDMFRFRGHPEIGRGRGALTAAEVQEIDSFARRYFIDLIPTFQTLGHWENILALPAYVGLAEYPGGRTLNIADERVYGLLDGMIGELSTAFSSPYFNMAADETSDVGRGANRERVAELGLARVLSRHYTRVAEIIRRHGKKPMIYGDIILRNPEILGMIPKDITIIDWNYDPLVRYESPHLFAEAGFPFIVSPAVRNYTGPFPGFLPSFENIQRFTAAGIEEGAGGVLVSSWNDYGGEELRELNLYGYAWGAECAWRPLAADPGNFSRSFFRDFFGTSDDTLFRTIFALLSSPSNHYTWYELWRHPMLPLLPPTPQKGHSPNVMERLQSIKSTMPLVISLLPRAKEVAARNVEYLEYLRFVAQLNLWFARKVESLEVVQEWCSAARGRANRDSLAGLIVGRCRNVLEDLAPLRRTFSDLWLKTNRAEGLGLLLMRYDRQAACWEEKIGQVGRGEFSADPEIESGWIYHPGLSPGAGTQSGVQHAFFRKVIRTPREVRSASLQLIGQSYARVWVNGRAVGEVYVRRSNSWSAEQERVKVVDILPFLTDTISVIAAEAQDFSDSGSAGVNVYGEVRTGDGALTKILSDESWKVAPAAPAGWSAPAFDDAGWMHAVRKVSPYAVIRPDLAKSRKSWIER